MKSKAQCINLQPVKNHLNEKSNNLKPTITIKLEKKNPTINNKNIY